MLQHAHFDVLPQVMAAAISFIGVFVLPGIM